MTKLTLYTKPDCCLCDDAKAAIERVRKEHPFDLEEVDITSDESLLHAYGERIPVVLVDGARAFQYTVDEEELKRRVLPAPEGVT